jgi:hypothetical protein
MNKILKHCAIAMVALACVAFSLSLPLAMAMAAEPAIARASAEVTFLMAGLLGMLAHYAKKALAGDVLGTVVDYFLRDHKGRSAAAVFGFGTAAAAVLSTGIMESASMWAALGAGFTTGWTSDSAFNKGD